MNMALNNAIQVAYFSLWFSLIIKEKLYSCLPLTGNTIHCNATLSQYLPYFNGMCHQGTEWNEETKCCIGHPECGPGRKKSSGGETACVPCPYLYYSVQTSNKECFQCLKCEDLKRKYSKQCLPIRDSVCGACIEGYQEPHDLPNTFDKNFTSCVKSLEPDETLEAPSEPNVLQPPEINQVSETQPDRTDLSLQTSLLIKVFYLQIAVIIFLGLIVIWILIAKLRKGAKGSSAKGTSQGAQVLQEGTSQGAQGSSGEGTSKGAQGSSGEGTSKGAKGSSAKRASKDAQGSSGEGTSKGAKGSSAKRASKGAKGSSAKQASKGAKGSSTKGTSKGAQGRFGEGISEGAQGSSGEGTSKGAKGSSAKRTSKGTQGSFGEGISEGAQGSSTEGASQDEDINSTIQTSQRDSTLQDEEVSLNIAKERASYLPGSNKNNENSPKETDSLLNMDIQYNTWNTCEK